MARARTGAVLNGGFYVGMALTGIKLLWDAFR